MKTSDICPDWASSTRGPLMTLRIIVAALALGVISFAAVTIAHNIGKPQVLAGRLDPLQLSLLALGLVTLLLGVFLPAIIFASSRNSPPQIPPQLIQNREHGRVLAIQQRIQISTIIGCALFEGGAFANLVGYMQTGELLHLGLVAVLLVGILAQFPTTASYQQRIENELRRLAEDNAFKRAP